MKRISWKIILPRVRAQRLPIHENALQDALNGNMNARHYLQFVYATLEERELLYPKRSND